MKEKLREIYYLTCKKKLSKEKQREIHFWSFIIFFGIGLLLMIILK